MKTDRYVVGYRGRRQVVYGADEENRSTYAVPLKSLGQANKRRLRLSSNAIIYRLVPVRRVKAKRGKL